MGSAFGLYGGQWCGILLGWPAQPLWRGVRTSTTRLMARLCGLGTGLPYGGAAMAGDRLASRALALMGFSSAFPFMLNSPQQWYALRHKVQAATAFMSDAALADRVAKLQLKWRRLRSVATFNLLQELYVEQHRRSHAS
jgi:hypothetical protein